MDQEGVAFNEHNHVIRKPEILLRYLRVLLPKAKDNIPPDYKVSIEEKVNFIPPACITIINFLFESKYYWINTFELARWLEIFKLYNVWQVKDDTFGFEYVEGLIDISGGTSNTDYYLLRVNYTTRSLENEESNICRCGCHVKGIEVTHIQPCCKYSQIKYINQDRTIDEIKYNILTRSKANTEYKLDLEGSVEEDISENLMNQKD